MMKYSISHSDDFSTPFLACLIGLLYASCTFLLAFTVSVKLCTQTDVLVTFSCYVGYTAVCFLPNFVYAGLGVGHSFKKPTPPLLKTKYRRENHPRHIFMWIMRVVYKILRVLYASFWFYFGPTIVIILPFIFREYMPNART